MRARGARAEPVSVSRQLHRGPSRRLRDSGDQRLTAEEVARRNAERPGYSLVSYGEVGLPVWKISVRAEVLEHKPIDAFSEFALRTVATNLTGPGSIRRLLGVHERVMDA